MNECKGHRQPDGSWGCLACKTMWDDGDTPPCQPQLFVIDEVSDVTPAMFDTLIAFADAKGYKLPPKTRQYLDLLDKTYGPPQRR